MCFTPTQERMACHDGGWGGLDVASGSWRDARGGRKFLVGGGNFLEGKFLAAWGPGFKFPPWTHRKIY